MTLQSGPVPTIWEVEQFKAPVIVDVLFKRGDSSAGTVLKR